MLDLFIRIYFGLANVNQAQIRPCNHPVLAISGICVCLEIVGCLSVLSSSPVKGSRCFIGQETLPSLISTGWFKERDRA